VHQRLVDAISGGDLDKVHDALIAHTMDSAEELVAMLKADLAAS
jgi:DNA-binding FadR family transcriptional regulator